MSFTCKVCAVSHPGNHCEKCRACDASCRTRSLCGECSWDRTCALCGQNLPHAPGNGDNMAMHKKCELFIFWDTFEAKVRIFAYFILEFNCPIVPIHHILENVIPVLNVTSN